MSLSIRTEGKMSKAEVQGEFAKCLNVVARKFSALDDIKDRKKELRSIIATKVARELAELRDLSKTEKSLSGETREAMGAYKLLKALLGKLGVQQQETKVDRLIEAKN